MEMSPAMLYLMVALALIAAELIIMQFSVFWFLFFGLGALLASVVGWLFPSLDWTQVTAVFLLGSLAIAALLFPPIKRWQNKPAPIAGNDAIGQRVKVLEAITSNTQGKVFWSGTDWPAQLADEEADLAIGETAIIRKLEGIRLIVGR